MIISALLDRAIAVLRFDSNDSMIITRHVPLVGYEYIPPMTAKKKTCVSTSHDKLIELIGYL
jgi:hypothetical protein